MPTVSKRLAGAGLLSLSVGPMLAAGLTTQDGAFTLEQAERGHLVYEQYCVSCHELEFYESKLPAWQDATVAELFEALSATMPTENPGGLTDAQYLDVLAYVFSITGSPAGDSELTLMSMASIEIAVAPSAIAQ